MNENYSNHNSILSTVVYFAPFFVFVDCFYTGIIISITLFIACSAAASLAIFLPISLSQTKFFLFILLGSAIATSISGSVINYIDPIFFNANYTSIFFVSFALPVLRFAKPPSSNADKDNQMESLIYCMGFIVAIVIMGGIRELLASGSISFGKNIAKNSLLPIASQSAGVFFILGFVIAGYKAFTSIIRGE